MNKLHQQMTNDNYLIARNYPISRSNYQNTNHSGISISLDEQIEQNNDERQADNHMFASLPDHHHTWNFKTKL